jgi:hypothetical protein
VVKAPIETDCGGWPGHLLEPGGHPCEIAHKPFATLEDDDSLTLPR